MSVLLETTFTNKEDTRSIVDEVMEHAFESVCSTMGPNGNYVVINQTNLPKVTKDGVSVANALDFNEARRNLIAKIITEPSIKTDMEVGDGTTTTVFQTYHLYKTFKDKMTFKNVRYLDAVFKQIRKFLETKIIGCDVNSAEFRSMLLTSSNYEEEIVDKVLEIYQNYDKPNITLRRNGSLKEDSIEFTREIYFEGAYGSDAFVSNGGKPVTIENNKANFIIIDGNVNIINNDIMAVISAKAMETITVLIARNYDPSALNVISAFNHNLQRCAILPLKLNAAGTLGTSIFNDLGELLEVRPTYDITALTADDITFSKATLVVKPNGFYISKEDPTVEAKANKILKDLDNRYESMLVSDRQLPVGRELFKRISRLRGNNVTIMITGVTGSDMMERYYRYEDVMKAAGTGLQYGVIPGIGYGYMEAAKYLKGLQEQSDVGHRSLLADLCNVLTRQYTQLTGISLGDPEFGTYIDLVTGDETDIPVNVYDNAAATMIALEGAWATAKTLSKINNVMGRSNKSY